MKNKLIAAVTLGAALVAATAVVAAEQRVTPKEAETMVRKAVVFNKGDLQMNGDRPRLGPVSDASGQAINIEGGLKKLETRYKSVHADLIRTEDESRQTHAE